ncbi:cell division protein FtsQ/DivIB [Weissella kandleri]|uniref:cell division protein FtsQ/DivIB n=1 Tax=Weissella kandleri TaxID=1616 RepID=UPI00387E521F
MPQLSKFASIQKWVKQYLGRHLNSFQTITPDADAIVDTPAQKRKRRKQLTNVERNSVHMLVIFVLLSGFLALLISPVATVKKVTVVGNRDLTKKDVLRAANVKNEHMFAWQLFSEQQYFIQEAQKDPAIQAMHIKFLTPTIAQIKIEENVKVGIIQQKQQEKYLLADGQTMPVEKDANTIRNLPTYNGFKHQNDLLLVAKQFGHLSQALRSSVSEVIWSPVAENNQRVILIMNDGNKVLVNANQIDKKLKYYPGMVVQTHQNGTFDFQVGSFFKPY